MRVLRPWLALLVAPTVVLAAATLRGQEPPDPSQTDVPPPIPTEPWPAAEGSGEAAAPEEEAEEEEPSEPTPVYVGVYITRLVDVDLPGSSLAVDFWIWFRWQGDDVDPLHTFEVIGGQVESRASEISDVVGEYNYAAARIVARAQHFYDIERFPLDNHELRLYLEDVEHETHELVYIPDETSSGLDPDVEVAGWNVSWGGCGEERHLYHTNYGDITLPSDVESEYSRFHFELHLTRPGMGYFWKLFWGALLATLIGLMSLIIHPSDPEPRLALPVGALFASVANAYVITQSLPETPQVTLAERVSMLSVAFIFVAIIISVFSVRLAQVDRADEAKRIDRWSLGVWLIWDGMSNFIAVMV